MAVNDRRRGLGKGLGALIPTTPTDILSERTRNESAILAADGVSRETEPEAGGVTTLRRPITTALGTLPIVMSRTDVPQIPLQGTRADDSAADEVVGVVGSAEDSDDGYTLRPVPGAYFAEIPQREIRPNPSQPRTEFDQEAMAELVHSISEVGLLQPIVVRRLPVPEGEHRFELIMGERRWRASQEAGLAAIPAIVRDTEDNRMLLDALLENLHRAELNPLEEAAAYDQLLKDFECTHEELATKIGRSRPYVSNTLRLLGLPPAIQSRVAAGVLSAGHARGLLALSSVEDQEKLAKRIIAEGLSVRAVEEITQIVRWDAGALDNALSAKTEDYLNLDDPPRKPKGIRAGSRLSPRLEEIAGELSERFETRVKVELAAKRGKIVVEFASKEDLERIFKVMLADVD